jgi:hypothetical protein
VMLVPAGHVRQRLRRSFNLRDHQFPITSMVELLQKYSKNYNNGNYEQHDLSVRNQD